MRKLDVSIHFTTKGQSVEQLNQKLTDWWKNPKNQNIVDFSESDENKEHTTLHHCFLHEYEAKALGIPLDAIEMINEIGGNYIVRWRNTNEYGIEWSRKLMLQSLKRANGLALFVGEIKDSVLDEWNEALELHLDCIHIP